MDKPFTILHISDLHRSAIDPISNDELISALVSDRDRYIQETPKISSPEAIIVSGDIIQGVPLGTVHYGVELNRQYAVAEKFLDELTKRFINGDRSKIILIPGNHDVDWNVAFSAMEEVNPECIPDFGRLLRSEFSDYRIDWKTCKTYRIADGDRYAQRMKCFWQFFERFYAGVPGLLKVGAHSDFNLFSWQEGRIGLAAFNSCEGNDCFADHGMILRDAIARSHLELQDLGTFDLQIAIWHRNIEGGPYRTDYMDMDIVRGMIGRNYRLGLYGHQHKAQAVPYEISLPGTERMAVVSAGSLCAGRNDLPTGIPRQYNLLEIAADLRSVKVHIREMSVANLFSKGRLRDLGGGSFAELNWDLPKNPVGLQNNTALRRKQAMIIQAEQEAQNGNYLEASRLLKGIDLLPNSHERSLYLTTLIEMKDWKEIIRITEPPATIDELVKRAQAFGYMGDYSKALASLEIFSPILNLPEPEKERLRRWVDFLNLIKL